MFLLLFIYIPCWYEKLLGLEFTICCWTSSCCLCLWISPPIIAAPIPATAVTANPSGVSSAAADPSATASRPSASLLPLLTTFVAVVAKRSYFPLGLRTANAVELRNVRRIKFQETYDHNFFNWLNHNHTPHWLQNIIYILIQFVSPLTLSLLY